MESNLKSNIINLYLIKIAHWFMLFMPIVVLFYEDNGLEMRHVFILQAIYSVSIVVLEIPSGYLADAIGRRKTIIIGTVLGTLGFLTYSFSYGFIGFLVAEVILGIGQSLISGADSALLYDSLSESGQKEKYIRYEGRMVSVGNFSEAIAGVLGGLLATLSLRYPYYAQTIIAAIAIPASILLVEPKTHKEVLKLSFMSILNVVKYALHENKELKWNIIFSSVIGASTLTMAWFVQPYLKLVALPLSLFGIMWTLLNLSVGISSMFAHKVESYFKFRKLLIGIAVLIPAGFIIISQISMLWGISVLFAFYLVRGIATPVLKDYINKLCESNVRATILSVRNFVIRIIFAIIGPFVGWYTDNFSLQEALLITGLIILVLAIFTLIMQLRRKVLS